MTTDIRWIQRLSNYSKALIRLKEALELDSARPLSDLEKQGLIQAFEFTHELAWNTIKDFYEFQGESGLQGSRDVARLAFRRGLIASGEIWMDMIKSRNRSSHTYDEKIAESIVNDVRSRYIQEFVLLEDRLNLLKKAEGK
ncbi:MAG: nucleotidyltransferase substrate binding protein [Proteobacteria bacterium]|nr:nucleotidyltransferase substrate binding protein [Pseudomonadota bacterium]MBU1687162.1 nucleotidyltransferase substrate binding protein [Pseudomonadota bacterium]